MILVVNLNSVGSRALSATLTLNRECLEFIILAEVQWTSLLGMDIDHGYPVFILMTNILDIIGLLHILGTYFL